MISRNILIVFVINLIISNNFSFGGNILSIFPFTARSHYIMFETLLLELHKRGHNITVLSHFPQSKQRENFKDISLVGATRSFNSNLSLANIHYTPYNIFKNLQKLHDEIDYYEPVLNLPEVQKLLKSPPEENNFDLIITELFNTDIFLGFVHVFKSPFIAISSSPLMPWAYSRFLNDDNPAYVPVVFTSFGDNMNFMSRTVNCINLMLSKVIYQYWMDTKSQRIANKYFPNIPPLSEIARNTSLILVNTHFSLHKAVSVSPKVIQVGGMHVRPHKKLDKALDNFINDASYGVILFSMGSMFRAETLSEDKHLAFHKAFARIPQKIIWKWESNETVRNTDQILYMKWIPQRDVLAHSNLKLFIYHGGLMGTTEAVYCGVPILGIPMYGDMAVNMAAVTSEGAGITLTMQEITEDTVFSAIQLLINNTSYKKNAERLSEIFKDRPRRPLEEAVYWTEYAMKYKGAPHLTSPASKLNWFQYYLIDVYIFILAITLLIAFVIMHIINIVIQFIKYYFRYSRHKKTN